MKAVVLEGCALEWQRNYDLDGRICDRRGFTNATCHRFFVYDLADISSRNVLLVCPENVELQ